jgi:hypothetical protein
MHTKKRKLLEALERSLGVVATACTAANISRRTHYNWMKEDAQYRAEVESIEEVSWTLSSPNFTNSLNKGT